LWLALPATAQFELVPEHVDYTAKDVVNEHPDYSKGLMRIPYKQVQRHRAQAFKGQRVQLTRCGRLYLLVENVDRVVAKAVGLGATAQAPVTYMFWGDRCGMVLDPDGYMWMVGTHRAEPTPQGMRRKMMEQMPQQPAGTAGAA
jgi:hypothetical protein